VDGHHQKKFRRFAPYWCPPLSNSFRRHWKGAPFPINLHKNGRTNHKKLFSCHMKTSRCSIRYTTPNSNISSSSLIPKHKHKLQALHTSVHCAFQYMYCQHYNNYIQGIGIGKPMSKIISIKSTKRK